MQSSLKALHQIAHGHCPDHQTLLKTDSIRSLYIKVMRGGN